MITQVKFSNHGRTGNQCFQLASLIGFSKKYKTELVMPAWKYSEYFNCDGIKFKSDLDGFNRVNEFNFHFTPEKYDLIDFSTDIDLHGYFQSEKYFAHCKEDVKKALTFKPELINQIRRKYYAAWQKKTIAIHIRRGDYVDNPNYELLPINYFITALFEHFPNWQKQNLMIFSDDIPYCKVHFDCLDNVFFAEGNSEVEDLALMTQCDNFIISNSSYSWFGAWLGEKPTSKVIRPQFHFKGQMAVNCDIKDFYPARWISHNHTEKMIDLSDVTFTIPVALDHNDRKKNLDLCICMLQHHFKTNIIICEQGGMSFSYMQNYCQYTTFSGKQFHRTLMLNEMAMLSNTPIVANWDADVIVAPLQIWATVDAIRKGADMCYPYEWAFARIPRDKWFKKLEARMDIGIVGDTKFNGMNNGDAVSVGGAVLFNKKSFIEGGGENEKFISFGPEDAERYHRFTTLGYNVKRTLGPIYHINHYVGRNSSNKHPHVKENRAEWYKVKEMNKAQLKEYVKTWH